MLAQADTKDRRENMGEDKEILRVALAGLNTGSRQDFDLGMQELSELARACDMQVEAVFVQNLDKPVAATYIGQGKAGEINEAAEALELDTVIFEDTLSPAQLKNLQRIISVRIMDRTGLILEIFSKRAKTREARLQVEAANLQYMLPRLIGMWEAIGRQGGGSGSKSNKGIGETQLELDRRWIQKRMTELDRELEAIEHDRTVQRGKREKSQLPLVALVGYTNAGKSTIMNALLSRSKADEEKRVFEKDMLFATLDTQVRYIRQPDKKDFLLSDTVGFVNRLPHSLIKAFRTTLDEIRYADLLLEIVDYSDDRHEEQMRVTAETLREIGADKIPIIHVMNKIDKYTQGQLEPGERRDRIFISAAENKGLDTLLDRIKAEVYVGMRVEKFLIPYDQGKYVSLLNEKARVLKQEYVQEGVLIRAEVTEKLSGMLEMVKVP